jgi:XTP/dITP diphosphohydrolase
MKLVLATTNRNKVLEIKDKFSGIGGLEILSLSSPEFSGAPEIVEDGLSFEENALKKAMAIAAFTGLVSMADDSGLCVDALDGRPGIYSARYGGEGATDRDRYLKLLDEMKGIGKRSARFVCAIAVAFPAGKPHSQGRMRGTHSGEPAGEKGFGYDPVFFLPEYGKTMAELPLEKRTE